MSSMINIQNREELKKQFSFLYPYISKDYADGMVNFILDRIKFSFVPDEEIIRFVNEINGALVDNIHRGGMNLYRDGKNDSNNLKDTARYRETYRLGRNYKNDIKNIIIKNTYEDAILLGNFFVSSIFDYTNSFHEFENHHRKSLITPNVSAEELKYGVGLFSLEEYEVILCKKISDILGINLDKARIFFENELNRIMKEKRQNI